MTPLARANQAVALLMGAHPMQAIKSIRLASGKEIEVDDLICAIFEAIRESCEAMELAAAECESSVVADAYRAMIYAALEEG